MSRSRPPLLHSVAFRVSEDQWVALQRYAEKKETTVPQLAKAVLFEKAGLEVRPDVRRRYGQVRRDAQK